ncbi:hypothetical protein Tco_1356445, partial [Tanacetum coccineum]
RYKDKVGIKIPDWMISEEMKHTKHYRMYAKVFGLDVPLTQSQPTESTQGTYRTPSAPRISTCLTLLAPVPTVDKADAMILQDTLKIEKMVDDSLLPRNDEPNIPSTRLDPRSDNESPEVEITNDKEVEITNDEERREKRKIVEESSSTPFPIPIRSPRIHTDLVSLDTKKLQELTELQGRYTYLFEHLKVRFLSRKSFDTLADHLQEVMFKSLPTMVDTYIKEQVKKQVPKQAEFSSQIQKAIDNHIPSQVDASVRSYMFRNILHVHPAQS